MTDCIEQLVENGLNRYDAVITIIEYFGGI